MSDQGNPAVTTSEPGSPAVAATDAVNLLDSAPDAAGAAAAATEPVNLLGSSADAAHAAAASSEPVSAATQFATFSRRIGPNSDFSELQARVANGERITMDQLYVDPDGKLSIRQPEGSGTSLVIDARRADFLAGLPSRLEPLRKGDPSGEAQMRADVAIIGTTGNVGMTTLTDIVAANADGLTDLKPVGLVRPSRTEDRIAPLLGPVRYTETLYKGVHEVNLTRDNFAYLNTPEGIQALREARIIVISAPDVAATRMGLFDDFSNYGVLQDPNKSIVLIRAGQGGQPVWSARIRNDPSFHATVVGVEDSPYGTRVHDRNEDGIRPIDGKRKKSVEVTSVGNPEQGLGAMRDLFPRGAGIGKPSWPNFVAVPGSAMPWRAGFFIHPGVALWPENMARTARGEKYLHYAEGVRDAKHGELLQELDDVKVRLGRAYGANPQTFAEKLNTQFDLPLVPGEPFHLTMARTVERPGDPLSRKVYTSQSPKDMDALFASRYIDEDLASVRTLLWYAERAGLREPALERYFQTSMQTLLDAGMSPREMNSKLFAYEPYLNQIPGGVPEIVSLLDQPHAR